MRRYDDIVKGERVVRLDANGRVNFDIHVPTIYPSDAHLDTHGNILVVDYSNPGAIIRTASMSIDLDTNIAHSNDPVAIELGGHSVLAHGLTANLKAERVRLESQVHGRFQRQ